MKNQSNPLPTTRREFFRLAGGGIGLLAFSRFAPSFLVQSTLAATPAPERDRSILVIVQLAGGNDGLNTVIPFEDAHYYRLRPTLAIDKKDVLRLSGTLGLHPGCTELNALFQEGKLGIVQNVGYPNPNRSHFRSTEIWESASDSDRFISTGWIGRFLDNTCAGAPGIPANAAEADPLAVHLSGEVPQSFLAGHTHSTFGLNPALLRRRGNKDNLKFLETLVNESAGADPDGHDNNSFLKQTMMDALVTEKRVQKVLSDYKPGVAYPGNNFAQSLRNVAGLIAAGLSTRVYFVSLGGFDTHYNQATTHQNLMRTLSQGLAAFQKDLDAHGLSDQVVTMTFSEFGRRPMENESKGTDHGTAAPLFVMGSKIKGGLHGRPPSLDLKRNQDLAFSTDFRQVYATMLDRWFNCPTDAILGKTYHPLAFL
ncbi:DUF1501 domain-containing protein [Termitidicoccus mucosus]|uniref:Twin-arginine translocation pathway signal protein n=1 Tax=Termitidicoccus mucosus TaxID=1184151 RepID=A0A178IML9_9BACT|nr:twin-arginine translocation pathway signal protein [Opitutaceae bacterium TSB47]